MNDIFLSAVATLVIFVFLIFCKVKFILSTYFHSLNNDLRAWHVLETDDERQKFILSAAKKNISYSIKFALVLSVIVIFVFLPIHLNLVINESNYFLHLTWESVLFIYFFKRKF